jgi:CheY-like chemotaxis protein
MPCSDRVLVVEDELLIQDLLQLALEDAGYEVTAARSGAEAVRLLEASASRFSALVTDINLGPSPDGWRVAQRGRELNERLAVVYISGDSAHRWSCHGVSESVMIAKPFSPLQIVAALSGLNCRVRT